MRPTNGRQCVDRAQVYALNRDRRKVAHAVLAIEGDLPEPLEEVTVVRKRTTTLGASDDERRRVQARQCLRFAVPSRVLRIG